MTADDHLVRARPDDLLGHVRESLAAAGGSPWLAVHAQADPPEGAWHGRDELLARADELVRATVTANPGVDPRLVWRLLPSRMAWPLAFTAVGLLDATGRLPRIDPAGVRLRVAIDEDGAGIDGLWISEAALLVPADDPLAARPDPRVRVAGRAERVAALAADLTAFMEPAVALAREGARAGAPALWASVADCLVGGLAAPRPDDAGPHDQRTRVAAVMDGCAGTPLARRVRWTGYAHEGAEHATMRHCACCLAYRWPGAPPDPPRPDGLDPRWDRYCDACPLLPDAEVAHRARHRLDAAGRNPAPAG